MIPVLMLTLGRVTKNLNLFPSDESMIKLLYMARQKIEKKWTAPIKK